MIIDRYSIKCNECLSFFGLENGGYQLSNDLKDVMIRAARYCGWLVEGTTQLCVLHRSRNAEATK